MKNHNKLLFTVIAALCISASAQTAPNQPIEPGAGNWRTWVISSGKDFRVPPPPSAEETRRELAWVKEYAAQADKTAQDQIRFWDAGPAYRWNELIVNRTIEGRPLSPFWARAAAYVPIAMYDTMVAVWDAKYHYNRPRPSQEDASIGVRAAVPHSPSYPSEHAAMSAAAAEVMAYLVPAEAQHFRELAEEAGRTRLAAGLEYPSDYHAGLELGRRVAAEIIAKARTDGSDQVWDGVRPTGPCTWTGANPGNVTGARWRPMVLSTPGEFRPAPPPACDSAAVQAEVAEVRNFPRATTDPLSSPTFTTNWKAFNWQSPLGSLAWPIQHLGRWVMEDKLNTPRAARAYAALGVTMFDAFIASQDGKFTYWYLRPAQLDNRITPLFPAPNFPSYPSNHSTFSASRATVLAHLFPDRADFILALAKEAGDSRIWAGIHYQMDNVSGVELGNKVAHKVIGILDRDGAQ